MINKTIKVFKLMKYGKAGSKPNKLIGATCRVVNIWLRGLTDLEVERVVRRCHVSELRHPLARLPVRHLFSGGWENQNGTVIR